MRFPDEGIGLITGTFCSSMADFLGGGGGESLPTISLRD